MDRSDLFTQCRAAVSAAQAARLYGLEFDRTGKKAICPFHSDHRPSLSFKNGYFRCWACGAQGSSIDLTMRLFDLPTPLEAVRKLDADFNLQLDVGKPQSPQELQEARRRAEQLQVIKDTATRFEGWRAAQQAQLCTALRIANQALAGIDSPADLDELTAEQALAIQFAPALEAYSDALVGSLEEQMFIFSNRKAVSALCERVCKNFQKSTKMSRAG